MGKGFLYTNPYNKDDTEFTRINGLLNSLGTM